MFVQAHSLNQAAQRKGWTYDAANQVLSPLRTPSRGQEQCKCHLLFCQSGTQKLHPNVVVPAQPSALSDFHLVAEGAASLENIF